jgi:hypothetical protein
VASHDEGGSAQTPTLDPQTALEVLGQLHEQLGPVDPDVRAIVALRVEEPGSVALTDVTMHGNQVLEAPAGAAGLIVVTAEQVRLLDGGSEPITLEQLVCILVDGTEVGLQRSAAGEPPRHWTTADEDAADLDALRPRDVASNTARRALGLPSLADVPPVTDLLARAWLLRVAGEALVRFDAPEGMHDVEPEELEEVASIPPLGDVGGWEDGELTWDDIHAAAVDDRLELGPFGIDAAHAAWLDPTGLAQWLDVTLPSVEELLAQLGVAGDSDLLAWAIEELTQRDWYVVA